MDYKEKLKNIVSYMNERFNQDTDEYDFFMGSKPMVIRYDDETAISTWACGAVICIGSAMFFISEDDGFWYLHESVNTDRIDPDGTYSDWAVHYGSQDSISIAWVESLSNAMIELKKYVDENGYPVYFSGTTNICHHTLSKEEANGATA